MLSMIEGHCFWARDFENRNEDAGPDSEHIIGS